MRLPNGELLMDVRDDGRAYGMYDHAMPMEYEEDEQGDTAVDETERRVVDTQPFAPLSSSWYSSRCRASSAPGPYREK